MPAGALPRDVVTAPGVVRVTGAGVGTAQAEGVVVARDLALVARWRNGSASDPRSEGWGLESLSDQICARLFTVAAYHFFLYSTAP